MKKRILIPGVLIGVVAYLVSQFLSFNIGDLSIPNGSKMVSVESQASPTTPRESITVADAATTAKGAADDAGQPQSVAEVSAEMLPEKLLLVDIVIDGDRFNVNRVTDRVDALPQDARQSATVDEIIALVQAAQGDKSGTRVRVSRTSEAVASAETRLMEALQKAGVSSDEVERRSRLVE